MPVLRQRQKKTFSLLSLPASTKKRQEALRRRIIQSAFGVSVEVRLPLSQHTQTRRSFGSNPINDRLTPSLVRGAHHAHPFVFRFWVATVWTA